jgi:thymidylate synthase
MISLTAGSANELYVAACRAVRVYGRPVSPRGLATWEVLGFHAELTDPRRRLIDVPGRNINPAFAVAEALWILSGSDDPWIYEYNRALRRYADDGILQGAYGPRIRRWRGVIDQLDHVRRLLIRDPDSRQAVIQLFDPERDTRGYRDVPCTLGYRFFVRDRRLQMHTTMRSQDLWLGLPYDIFTTTLLQELLAGWLGVEVGAYHHHVDSLHLYEANRSEAMSLPSAPEPSWSMSRAAVGWEDVPGLLSGVIAGSAPADVGETWAAFAAVMASYRDWTRGQRDQARAAATGIPGELGRALERWYAHLAARSARSSDSPPLDPGC